MSDSIPALPLTREMETIRLPMVSPPNLDALFYPRGVAIIGASQNEEKSGGYYVKRIKEWSYHGAIYPINLKEKEIFGLRAYPSILEVPGQVDLAVFTIPAAGVLQAMDECATQKVPFIVVHTSGFREIGKEGQKLEARLVSIAREGGVRFVGPNCMGIFSNPPQLSFLGIIPEPVVDIAGVAFISQSGTLCTNFIAQGRERGIYTDKAISYGNEADLRFSDYLAYFATDPKIRVIAAYIEGVRDGRRLLELAGTIARAKPLVFWKGGQTNAGGRATLSHTGSIAGSSQLTESAFRQAGILVGRNMDEVLDLVAATYSPYLPQGNRVGILVDTGGGAVAAADGCESAGLTVITLSDTVQQRLRQALEGHIPPFSGITNPVDLVSPTEGQRVGLYQQCLELMAPEVDSFILLTFHNLGDPVFLQALEAMRDRFRKPIFLVPAIPHRQRDAIKQYTRRGIPSYFYPEKAARGLKGLVEYSRYLKAA